MARAVSPWTWRRALRDHGPRNPSLLLTALVIGTYMDRDGIAYPSQQLIAAGIRASVKTVQRHIVQLHREGWLGIEHAGRGGKGWRHYVYRATVPDELELGDSEELMACAITAQIGEVAPHRGDTIVSSPCTNRGDIIVSPRDQSVTGHVPKVATISPEGGDIRRTKVATFDADRGDTSVPKVATQLCRTNSGSETPALRTHASEEAQRAEAHNAQSRVMRASRVNRNGGEEKRKSRLTDEQLYDYVQKLEAAGARSISDVLRLLANYEDVTDARVMKVLRQYGEARQ